MTDEIAEQQNAGAPEHAPRRRLPAGLIGLAGLALLSSLIMAALLLIGPPGRNAAGGGPALTPVPDRISDGALAPVFESETPAGEPVSLEALRGRPVVLNFWATWCAPCRVEMPALQRASERYAGEGLTILAVNAMEPAGRVTEFMDELGLTFPAVLDPDGEILDLYGVRVFPTTIVVDAEGRIRAEHYGPLTDEQIDEYLALAAGQTDAD